MEVLVWLILFALASVVISRLSYQTMQALRTHQLTLWEHDSRESLITQLRADLWSSSTFTCPYPTELLLTTPTGPRHYRIEEGRVTRSQEGKTDATWQLTRLPQFQAQGPLLQVAFPTGRQVSLPCVPLLLQEKEAR